MKSFKIFKICEICPADHLKAEKKKGLQRHFPHFFFYQQALGRAKICLTVQQILGHSIDGNAINLSRKILISFVANL